ncbi:GntR family transcriptional regulator [Skermanella stibiiresistens SB22]|uniref:GntR family transcriptional regulator n=1 Tax=Skermanella stibiiresistens SB22 TaxID=1385369 RepID=W9H4X1_9PROT|nr:FadR/GntR family transcriptional regulator [Skermanella stibiiresistens]EWY39742.1 GntR family transcriptional regulator [Skermanella stibiiresistens SB22]
MPIQTVETQRLYQQVAGQLGELIRQGEFPPGHRLPPERDLARQLGVSRPTVREAMIALEIAGLVEVRTGSGAYVRDAAPPFASSDIGPSPFDLIAARMLVEPEVAAMAAANASDADLAGIAEVAELMRRGVAAGRATRAEDRLFHVRIAAATGNSVVAAMVERLWDDSDEPIFAELSRRAGLPENQRVSVVEHDVILDALRLRDARAARDAMRDHLLGVQRIMMAEEWPSSEQREIES